MRTTNGDIDKVIFGGSECCGEYVRMILSVDTSNIRTGGGVTHLVNLVPAAEPLTHGYYQVIIWNGRPEIESKITHEC